MKITRLLAFSVARTGFWVLLAVGTIGVSVSAWVDDRSGSTNSIGMRMIRIPRGTFMMGSLSPTPESLKVYEPSSHEKGHLPHGDWDEHPVHEVTISRDFLISETEVTAEQYRHFAPYYQDAGKYSPYVSGISWEEASAFCEWLSEIEGKPYRLPTEAEWEYACRAGTRTLFSSGDLPPEDGEANPWGVRNMHTGVLEWCLDWYGEYDGLPQSDPIGAVSGLARVVRGGGLQHRTPFYQRSANRGSAPPDFQGQHLIGFRVVQASWPDSVARKVEAPFFQQCVKQEAPRFKKVGEKPYFKRRVILPIPPENVVSEASRAAGFHPGILGHNHSPALEVCPNGDLIAVYFTSVGEGSPDAALIGTRLRYGAEEWDMPELLFDLADVNDVAPLLWNDNGKLHLFWGAAPPGLADLPFWFVSSSDNGATWSGVRFPFIRGRRVLYYGQPISTAFRDRDGTMYVPTDGVGGHSLLWASRDGGVTWFDTGGRTGGRHTCFVLLPDGRIFGMGGKNTDIDGFMPQSFSSDNGRTWEISKSPFPPLSTNQRPAMIRLASGNLFYAGDYQNFEGEKPPGVTGEGAFVALSRDEGKTWHVKTLPEGLPHEAIDGSFKPALVGHRSTTLGYAVARQAQDETIHLLTSMNHPSLHFEMNEAWILSDAGVSHDNHGRYRLEGTKTFKYPSGRKQWEVTYRQGYEVGKETFWTPGGKVLWTWEHRPDGRKIWTQFWSNGQKKSQSEWINHRCTGTAIHWDRSGRVTGRWQFKDGRLVK